MIIISLEILLKEAAVREVYEETGIRLNKNDLELICVNDDILPDVHFVTIGLLCKKFEGSPKVKEPEEITKWEWFKLNDLPKNLYFPTKRIILKFLENFSEKKESMFSSLNINNYQKFYSSQQKIIFASIPSNLFYVRSEVTSFIIRKGCCPFNPFMIFDYNLLNVIPKEIVRISNNNLIRRCDEVWCFMENLASLTDGVLFEIQYAISLGKKVRFFRIPEFKKLNLKLEWREKEYYGWDLTKKEFPIVYTAFSSRLFYLRIFISEFVLRRNVVPLNPFMSFDYFLVDKVDRRDILISNSTFIKKSDELWVFGPISDGVLAEIKLAKSLNKPIRYFKIIRGKEIKEISKEEVEFEEGLDEYKNEL